MASEKPSKKLVFDSIWEDREVKFDIDINQMRLRPGEFLIDRLDNIEDTKGSNGDRGVMKLTNLRLIWHAHALPRINMSIGYNCIDRIESSITNSHLRGQTESMDLKTKKGSQQYHFQFTCLHSGHSRLFATVSALHRAYETSTMYRELKMRGCIIKDQELILLPKEEQCTKIDGVWNLSGDRGDLGFFILTNIRVVWFSSSNPYYNVSIPYLQIRTCKIRDSKFGLAFIIETSQQSGEYVMGFRIDPPERLEKFAKEVKSLRTAYYAKPIFGVEFVRDDSLNTPLKEVTVPLVEDDVEIDSKSGGRNDALAAYFVDGATSSNENRGPVFSEDLGLAIERLRDGFTLKDLWEINVD